MKTSNFQTWSENKDKMPGAISIARRPALHLGWSNDSPAYGSLAPSEQLFYSYKAKKTSWVAYERIFEVQLILLEANTVANELLTLVYPHEPILLCWENPHALKRHPCHRRLVAKWLYQELGMSVPEFSLGDPELPPPISATEHRPNQVRKQTFC